jgi:hypothetical protein
MLGIAQAASYIVNQQSPAADDANAGTVDKPFKTISAAVAKLHAGDTITMNGGINLFWSTFTWTRPENRSQTQAPSLRDRATFARWGKTQGSGTYSVEEWSKIRGFDEHSLQWDPRFVSPQTFDYRLTADSPAIGAGEATASVSDDYLGRQRPAGRAPSIGALEYFPEPRAMPAMPMR